MESKFLLAMVILALFLASVMHLTPSPSNKTLAITFDLEYSPEENFTVSEQEWKDTVNQLVKISEENNVSFQFNVLGRTAEEYPELVRNLSQEDQGISCHTYSHLNQLKLNYTQKLEEVSKCKHVVQDVTGEKVTGNRFPYTKSEEESFQALKEAGYRWDSSKWKHNFGDSKNYKGIYEFPLASVRDDWSYFIYANESNSTKYFQNIGSYLENNEGVIVIDLHPWVLSLDKTRMEEFEEFISRVKGEVKIESLDRVYQNREKPL